MEEENMPTQQEVLIATAKGSVLKEMSTIDLNSVISPIEKVQHNDKILGNLNNMEKSLYGVLKKKCDLLEELEKEIALNRELMWKLIILRVGLDNIKTRIDIRENFTIVTEY